MKNKRLTYTKVNNSNNVIQVDLNNGYSVIAISGWNNEKKLYITTRFLKDNSIDTLKLIEKASSLEFHADYNTIYSAILKKIGTYLENGFFDEYISRYEYEMRCFDLGVEIVEVARMGMKDTDVS